MGIWAWDEIKDEVLLLLDETDTILIGRKLAVEYIPYWQQTSLNLDDPMIEVAKRIVKAKKVVSSKTMDESLWENTELINGGMTREVNRLKNLPGKNMVVYGGSSLFLN